jgi:hypothetical protein
MRILVTCLGVAMLAAACEEEKKDPPPPPQIPTVQAGQAVCERIENRYVLRSVAFEVEDLDGVADLKKVEARVERFANLQPLATEDIALTQQQIDEAGLETPVRRRYSWARSPEGPNFYCGVEGDLLDVFIRAEDSLGFFAEILVGPTQL